MTDATPPASEPQPPVTPPAAPPAYGTPAEAKPPTILSLLSMIGGIAGLVLSCCFGAGLIFAIAGIVLGHLAPSREPAGRGMAKTGLITGYIGAALSVIFLILAMVAPALLAFLPFMAGVPLSAF